MANSFGSLYIGSSSLRNHQNAINTTANNLANVGTTGHVRQQVLFTDENYIKFANAAISPQQYGLGVSIGDVVHTRDMFLDKLYRSTSARSAFYETSYEAAYEVQTYLQEMEGKQFQNALKDFWNAFNNFGTDPGNSTAQNMVIQKASLFLSRSKAVYSGLKSYQKNINTQISEKIDKVNELAQNIFDLNYEIQKIEALDYEDLRPLVDMDALRAFRANSLNPEHPATRGTTVNPDIFFQCREACNQKVDAIPEATEKYMAEISKLTGRKYHLFNYYGAPDAERVIILMGSAVETAKETVDYLTAKGEKVGLINVHLYRPFSVEHFLAAVPAACKRLAVLDRTKEPGSAGEPLYQDVCTIYQEWGIPMEIVSGRYGLSSKDTTPGQILAVFENLKQETPKNHFTVGIVDDVTFTSLPVLQEINTTRRSDRCGDLGHGLRRYCGR